MDEGTPPNRRASVNANTMKTKILVIEPPKARDVDFRLLPTIHLCPDAEDLYWGYGATLEEDENGNPTFDSSKARRPVLHWDRLHLNCRWFHLMTAITPSGRHSRLTRKNPDGTWDPTSGQLVWASVGRWKGTSRHYRPGLPRHDRETCEECQEVRRWKREGRTSR